MINQLLYLGLLYFPSTHGGPGISDRIMGGSSIDISEVPYHVGVGSDSKVWCGGAIIDPKFILTAAHCFDHIQNDDKRLVVYVGMNRVNSPYFTMKNAVKKLTLHDKYNKKTNNNDIAVLELEKELTFNSHAKAINMPAQNAGIPIGAFGYVSGWGRLDNAGKSANQLQGASIQFLSPDKCKVHKAFNEKHMICAGTFDGSIDTCKGDSGGALVYHEKVYGIASFGEGCGNIERPGVYTNVASFRDFIKKVTGI